MVGHDGAMGGGGMGGHGHGGDGGHGGKREGKGQNNTHMHTCPVPGCGKTMSGSDMRRHVRTVHLRIQDYKCDQCGSLFGQKGTALRHLKVQHERVGTIVGHAFNGPFFQSPAELKALENKAKAREKEVHRQRERERQEAAKAGERERGAAAELARNGGHVKREGGHGGGRHGGKRKGDGRGRAGGGAGGKKHRGGHGGYGGGGGGGSTSYPRPASSTDELHRNGIWTDKNGELFDKIEFNKLVRTIYTSDMIWTFKTLKDSDPPAWLGKGKPAYYTKTMCDVLNVVGYKMFAPLVPHIHVILRNMRKLMEDALVPDADTF
jgi:hypothetical protein